jgi:diguanylate cyclase (GGDEF)-like protein
MSITMDRDDISGEATGERTAFVHCLAGALFGSSFVVVGLLVALTVHALAPNPEAIVSIYAQEPLLWIISLSPFVQGGSFYLVGRARQRLERELRLRVATEAEMRHLAFHDELTGLPNRACLFAILDGADVDRGDAGTVMMLDLDKFKNVNDTLGHLAGDALLKTVAVELVRSFGRRGWRIHRLGGDEFAIVVRDGGGAESVDPAAEVIDLFSRPFFVGEASIQLGVSIGVCHRGATPVTGREMLRRADVALYAAKNLAGSHSVVFDAEMDAAMCERAGLERDLGLALASGQFELHFQPIFEIDGGALISCEALLRWNSPSRGLVPPVDFIGIAEETGLIVEIGRWVLIEACREAAKWPEPICVAVNVSPVQFRNWTFLADLGRALDLSGLPARRLTLEITESLLIDDIEDTVRMLERIRGIGVKISLDDFGTGYSSLSYLHRIPVDRIKVDASFIRRMEDNPSDARIVEAVVGLSQGIDKRVTIEGIESVSQLHFVRELGADEAQGYLLSRPLRVADLHRLMEADRRARSEVPAEAE